MEQTTKSGTPEKTESAVADAGKEKGLSATQSAGHRLVHFIIQDEGMMNMTKQEILGVLKYAMIAISELFSPATLREAIDAGENRNPATSNHQDG